MLESMIDQSRSQALLDKPTTVSENHNEPPSEQKRIAHSVDLSQEKIAQPQKVNLKILPHREKFELTMSLVEQLANGKGTMDRVAAAQRLKEIECPEASVALCCLGLSDPDREVQRSVIDILHLSPTRQSLDWLCKISLPDIVAGQSFMAARILNGTEDKQVLEYLTQEGLSHPEPQVREATTRALFQTKDPEAIKALSLKGLQDPDDYVCRSAALALMGCGDEAAQQSLAQVLVYDPSPWVREGAAWGLMQAKSDVAESALCHVLNNVKEEEMLLIVCAMALEGTNRPEALVALRKIALEHSATHVRQYAILGLKGTSDIESLKAVHQILVNPQEEKRLKDAAAAVLASPCQQGETTCFNLLKSKFPNLVDPTIEATSS